MTGCMIHGLLRTHKVMLFHASMKRMKEALG